MGVAGARALDPAEGNALCARARARAQGLRSPGCFFFFSFSFSIFSLSPRACICASLGGQFPHPLPSLVRSLSVQRARVSSALGWLPGARFLGRTPSPALAPPRTPRHKSRRRKREERVCVNSNVRAGPGGGFVKYLPFLAARATRVPPPPCPHANRPLSKKPLKYGRGFYHLCCYCFFGFGILTSLGGAPAPPQFLGPLPSFALRAPLLPSPFPVRSEGASFATRGPQPCTTL